MLGDMAVVFVLCSTVLEQDQEGGSRTRLGSVYDPYADGADNLPEAVLAPTMSASATHEASTVFRFDGLASFRAGEPAN
ncbi:uncharacterized protein RHO25_006184 [Cercospora beticola]|uniref:Uncharacterized protein n=1 Tax=Cercospora beticola TaxID=122368 RepID=A0ABZ0NPR3_CERBT|nr:hypothetical protein RHO25_006184 [Cercospora beticola]